jgi:hypothetical protein
VSPAALVRARGDRLACSAAIATGGLLVLLAYLGVKGTPFPVDGFTYLASGGIAGLFCLAVGGGGIVCAGLYDEWRKLDRIDLASQGRPLPDPVEATGAARVGVLTTCRDAGPDTVALRLDWRGDGLRRGVLVTAAALLVSGAFVVVGWRMAARTADMSDSARGLAIGVVGLVLATVAMAGHTVWLRSRLVTRKQTLLVRYLGSDDVAANAPVGADGVAWRSGEVIVTATSRRFHRPGCPMIDRIAAQTIGRDEAGDRRPCGICRAE